MKYSDTTVIIPTLNEVENIKELVGKLVKSYPGVRIIVADDGSTDGTSDVVMEMTARNSALSLLDRSGSGVHGIAASVIDAARLVRTEKVVVMDADMQHPVVKVGAISSALDKADLVIGVRTNVKDWGIHRRILSKGMFYLSYLVFAVRRKHTSSDMMSGFFGIRSAVLRRVTADKRRFVLEGYKILLDIMRIADRDIKVVEIPYGTFRDRRHGRSNSRAGI